MESKFNTPKIIRWIARISGSLILIFILFFLIMQVVGEEDSGDGLRNTQDLITFIFFPLSTVLGLSIALKWEGLGGLVTTLGMVGLFVLRPDLLNNLVMAVPIVPGILYLVSWQLHKLQSK